MQTDKLNKMQCLTQNSSLYILRTFQNMWYDMSEKIRLKSIMFIFFFTSNFI